MHKLLNILLIAAGLLLVGLAVFYWLTPASTLPSFFPGYDSAKISPHFKHGLASLIVGLACFVWVWFRTGKKRELPKQ